MGYADVNESKASFTDAYRAATPHAYLAEMSRLGYQIGEQARPYCVAAAELLRAKNGSASSVQMLDIGCSYGLASAFVKYGCSFEEIVSFFDSRAPRERRACAESMRQWLGVVPRAFDMRVVGLDVSEPATDFCLGAGLLDAAITKNLENDGAALDEDDLAWVRDCNFVMSTGAIGYVTERTLSHVVDALAVDRVKDFGAIAAFTVLRMFDVDAITELFESRGWRFTRMPRLLLPQRKFNSDEEQAQVIDGLRARGVDVRGCETEGVLFAELFVAAPSDAHGELVDCMQRVADKQRGVESLFGPHVEVAATEPVHAAGAPA